MRNWFIGPSGARAFGRSGVLLLGLAVGGQADAQLLVRAFEAGQDTTRVMPRHPVIRVGKWVTLAGAAGAATYGIVANRDADQRYADLERLCQAEPGRCTRQSTNGPFSDAALEAEYQDILNLDQRAKYALAAGQVAVAASVVLFILDLPRQAKGEDIPYKPPRLHLGADGQGRLTVRYDW